MRIITGSARGTKLATLEGLATRPTSERVKESLFSMLQFDIEGRNVLDLFAGSGQLGLEALSLGANKAVFIDLSREAVDIIIANAKKTHLYEKCRVSVSDYSAFLKGVNLRDAKEKFHIIFVDPPYAMNITGDVLDKIKNADICSDKCIIAVESDNPDIFGDKTECQDYYKIIKQSKYGRIYITLLIVELQSSSETEGE